MLQIKPVFRCDSHFKRQFDKSKCLLTISVGQEVHEGEKFSSTVQLVNQNFKECVILVDDTLQRHTMALDFDAMSSDELLTESLRAGDAWLCRNKMFYSRLAIPVIVKRWDYWLQHPGYSIVRSMLLSEYSKDKAYKKVFEKTIDEFLMRYSRRKQRDYVTDLRARALCLEYVFEECSAMCLWPELGCQFELYPSGRNFAMTETHRRFVLPFYPDLLHSVGIKFKNRRQLLPQMFEFLPNFVENRISLQMTE